MRDIEFPRHRIIESYCSISAAELNPRFMRFGQSAMMAMRFLRSSGDFARFDYFVGDDIQPVERLAAEGVQQRQSLAELVEPYGELLGSRASPNIPATHPIRFYAAADSYQRVLDGARAEPHATHSRRSQAELARSITWRCATETRGVKLNETSRKS
jgi:hypothetical protein